MRERERKRERESFICSHINTHRAVTWALVEHPSGHSREKHEGVARFPLRYNSAVNFDRTIKPSLYRLYISKELRQFFTSILNPSATSNIIFLTFCKEHYQLFYGTAVKWCRKIIDSVLYKISNISATYYHEHIQWYIINHVKNLTETKINRSIIPIRNGQDGRVLKIQACHKGFSREYNWSSAIRARKKKQKKKVREWISNERGRKAQDAGSVLFEIGRREWKGGDSLFWLFSFFPRQSPG